MELISLREVLSELRSGSLCSLTAVTADVKRNKGGELLMLNACSLISEGEVKKEGHSHSTSQKSGSKSPNNGLLNLNIPGQARKTYIHSHLIMFFNGKRVTY